MKSDRNGCSKMVGGLAPVAGPPGISPTGGYEGAPAIPFATSRALWLKSAGAAADHPVHPALPETAYLKGLLIALD